ncbi:maleylpyruvate isomerase family mycothiol-dependent enzyme [Streptomyces sp. I05A-00742]|uniref:maleylpyruvate isomerase family mycothiol-dependent enzyme n=1 Tax=Streptomyces sp. I05A-00742 TaxID=2732853 RepID=UPI001489D1F1|nr:maleylpyruvate isomerase family mycothiol-dependent enzyme [Streptomyces sp. I05A-00742]
MSALTFDRRCAEIVEQTGQLLSHLDGVGMTAPVPSCPGWTAGNLVRHLTGALSWTRTIITTRAAEPVPHDVVDDVAVRPDEDPAALAAGLTEAAERLAEALRAAGPDAALWTVAPDGTAGFWARRMTHEAAVHRADAALAAGVPYTLDDAVALDALDEWMTFAAFPEVYEPRPGTPDLLGPGRTLHFHATGPAGETVEEWPIDLTGDAPVRRHTPGPGEAAVTVRGTPSALLLLVYRRPVPEGSVEVAGDTALLDLWRKRAGFWLEE